VDYRFDPFQNSAQPVNIYNELHTVPSSSPFVIRLKEVPVKDAPSTLAMRIRDLANEIIDATETAIDVLHGSWYSPGKVITIDAEKMLVVSVASNTLSVTRGYDSTTATSHANASITYIEDSLSEVSSSAGAGQFWPDYATGADSDAAWNTGTIQFNSSDAGKIVAVNYKGIGQLVDSRILQDSVVVYIGKPGLTSNAADVVFTVKKGYSTLRLISTLQAQDELTASITIKINNITHVSHSIYSTSEEYYTDEINLDAYIADSNGKYTILAQFGNSYSRLNSATLHN